MHIKLLFTLLLLSSLVQASNLYIKLGTTTSAAQVQQIRNIVQERGYALQVEENEERYKLYVGAFSKQSQALQALQTFQKIFPSAVAVKLRSQALAQTPENSQEQTNRKKTPSSASNAGERPFFVQAALGFHNTGSAISGNAEVKEPGTSGMSYGVGFGYEFSKKFWASVGYDVLGTGDFTLNNIYASLNYNFFQTQDLSVYGGALAGYSSLSWDSSLQEGAQTSGPSSFFAGAQVGLRYPLGLEGLSLFSNYSLASFNLKTAVEGTGTEGSVEQSMTHKIQLGLQYNF